MPELYNIDVVRVCLSFTYLYNFRIIRRLIETMMQNSLHEDAPCELSNPKSKIEIPGGPLLVHCRSCFKEILNGFPFISVLALATTFENEDADELLVPFSIKLCVKVDVIGASKVKTMDRY